MTTTTTKTKSKPAKQPDAFWADANRNSGAVDVLDLGVELMSDLEAKKIPPSIMCEALLFVVGETLMANARDVNHLFQLAKEASERLECWAYNAYQAGDMAVEDTAQEAKKAVG